MKDMQTYVDLGIKAARHIAGNYSNFGNAAEFAASSLAHDFRRVAKFGETEIPEAVLKAQERSGVDLTALLTLTDEQDQKAAVAAFVGGCYRYAAEAEGEEDEEK